LMSKVSVQQLLPGATGRGSSAPSAQQIEYAQKVIARDPSLPANLGGLMG
jgi:hypothetical protein